MEVLTCANCGAAVALVSEPRTTCPACDATVEIPEAHLALHAERRQLREARVAAERAWRRLPRALPDWFGPGTIGLLIILGLAAVIALPSVALANDWFGIHELDDGGWAFVALGLCGILCLWVVVVLDVFAIRLTYGYDDEKRSYAALTLEGGGRGCRICGAPLAFRPGDLAATCDYCGSDSVLTKLSRRARTELDAAKSSAKKSLQDAVSSLETIQWDRRLFRLVAWPIFGGCYLLVVWLVLRKMF